MFTIIIFNIAVTIVILLCNVSSTRQVFNKGCFSFRVTPLPPSHHVAQKMAPSPLDLSFLLKEMKTVPPSPVHSLCLVSESVILHGSRIQGDRHRAKGCERTKDAKNSSHDADLLVKAHSVIKSK